MFPTHWNINGTNNDNGELFKNKNDIMVILMAWLLFVNGNVLFKKIYVM